MMTTILQDLRYGLRLLLKSPLYTAIAVVTLAVGIGANTAIFSVVDGVLLRPLPYPDPQRLLTLERNLSAPELADVAEMTRSFSEAGGSALQPFDLKIGAEPLQGTASLVAGSLLEALGARAVVGRPLRESDDRFGGDPVVVLGNAIWRREWGGDRSVVGRTISLSGRPFTVVGVLSPRFRLPEQEVDLYVPLRLGYPIAARERGVHFLRTVFRLKPGVTAAAARADLDTALKEMARLHPDEDKGIEPNLVPLLDRVVGDSRLPLAILAGAVGLVLLIACANLANLQLARVGGRSAELAVRTALGASRPRLVRQILVESALLSLFGGGLGLLLASWGTGALLSRFPEALPRIGNVGADYRVALFTLALSLGTSVVFGLLPAWRAASGRWAELSGGSRTAGLDASRRARGPLVVSEIALAFVLLVGAGLLLRALWRLQSVRPGFDPDGVVVAHLDLPESRYGDIPAQTAFRKRILEALNQEPGVRAAMISEVPLSGSALDHDFVIDGWPAMAPGDEPSIYARSIMGDYFGTMRIPLRAGRAPDDRDHDGTELVGVVNESMVRHYFPKDNPIGRRLRWARQETPQWITIVGVAGDVRHFGLGESDEPAVYIPYAQSTQAWKRWMEIVARGPGGTGSLTELVRRKVHDVDPLLPIARLRGMEQIEGESLTRQRFNAEILAVFAATALLLACVGIFGVLWSTVGRRRAEIGVRMALGAAPSRVVREILGDALRLIALGVGIGLAAAFGLTRLMASLLFGVRPSDPPTYAGVALLLSAVALLASYIPARRAARIDPMEALRNE
jgi:putative ABC transport system permease protein